jgi:hypothetical protein
VWRVLIQFSGTGIPARENSWFALRALSKSAQRAQ